ncbi:MAG: molybdenum cofactor guanylyltransferase [Bacteroidetes bacterium]|jgi:molybdopterin-guanine dinucleotide biosynthesis protein A|nr:molybdenum cofactor guanylyltransferase [Bacteroidota bacterium]
MDRSSSVEGFILVGGRSLRMGSPKALLEVDGRPLVERVAAAVAQVVPKVSLVTDRPDEVSFLRLPVIPDVHHHAGPLAGLHAALNATASDTILLASCDLPFLTPHLLRQLIVRHGSRPATLPRTDRLHPVCALYDRSLMSLAETRLRAGLRSMLGFLEAAGYVAVDLASLEPPVDPSVLTNVNSPEDLAAARSARR